MAPVSMVVVGAGQRGAGYARWALRHPDRARVVGVAEPREVRRARFAAAGYHILLEKPMAPDEAGGRRIVAAGTAAADAMPGVVSGAERARRDGTVETLSPAFSG